MTSEPPDPSRARDAGEFAQQLRLLKAWAGNIPYARLEKLTGYPDSTLSDALKTDRKQLPALDLVRAFVIACGTDPALWEEAWRALSMTGQTSRTGHPGMAPRQLPPRVAGFTGRAAELGLLDETLDGEWPVTVISGTGGAGKTSLVLEWAHRVAERFPDGQLYVDLRGYSAESALSPGQGLSFFLRALGMPEHEIPLDAEGLQGAYRTLLADRQALIVLDNAAAAGQVTPLLPGSARCRTVVTSRHELARIAVRHGARHLPLTGLSMAEAVDLLTRLLGENRASAEPRTLRDLAQDCGGLPLALRIAAVRFAHGQAAYVAGLRDGDRLVGLALPGDPGDGVAATFAFSYDALPSPERQVFRRLGLLPGPDLTPAAAAALCGTPAGQALENLAAASLAERHGPGRYRLHDLLRHYARDRAEADEDAADRAAAVRRLLAWYVHSADAATRLLSETVYRLPRDPAPEGVTPETFASRDAARAWLEAEHACLIAAVASASRHGPADLAWHLADALRTYFCLRGRGVDWFATAQAGLTAAEQGGDARAQAAARLSLGQAQWSVGDLTEAVNQLTLASQLFESAGDTEGQASALNNLGLVHGDAARLDEARDCFNRQLALPGPPAAPGFRALTEMNLADLHCVSGRYEEALACALRALDAAGDDRRVRCGALAACGRAETMLGSYGTAAAHLTESLELAREIGDQRREADALTTLSLLGQQRGDGALAYARQAVAVARSTELRVCIGTALIALGDALLCSGLSVKAAASFEEAVAVFRGGSHRLGEARALIRLGKVLAEDDGETASGLWRRSLELLGDSDAVEIKWLTSHVQI